MFCLRVIDLGVMTPCDKILQAALDHKAGTLPQSSGHSIQHHSPESGWGNGTAEPLWGLRNVKQTPVQAVGA
jgi:hypothetical protein